MHAETKVSRELVHLLFVGQMVYSVRERCGRRLALEAQVDADIVSTVPESATPAALGYSAQVLGGHTILLRCFEFLWTCWFQIYFDMCTV